VRSGVVTSERSAERERCPSSSSGCFFSSSKASTRFLASSSSDSVTGPATDSPVFGLLFALAPPPSWMSTTWCLAQRSWNWLRMPPW
jgi:hypothetical protein